MGNYVPKQCSSCGGFGGRGHVCPTVKQIAKTSMKRFTMYRRGELPDTHSDIHKNAPDEPQFEGVVFSDGRCVLRWLTPIRSVSVWDSLHDALAIHGHPEYESEVVWHD